MSEVLTDEGRAALKRFQENWDKGDPIETIDLQFFLDITDGFDTILHALGKQYSLVAADITQRQHICQQWIDYRTKGR